MKVQFVSKGIKKVNVILLLGAIIAGDQSCKDPALAPSVTTAAITAPKEYQVPDTATIPHNDFGEMVRYGRELIINTAHYIGPKGTAGRYLGNKMNCANCHLDAGTRPFAFNFMSTHARYPQFRGRENMVLNLGERINNCVERPHNGTPLPLNSREIKAMESYLKWLSTDVPVGKHVNGDEGMDIHFPDRQADTLKGGAIFAAECASCHGDNGQGKWTADSSTYIYPPLWGPNSYQAGSSPSRVLKLARFIKANMPDKKATWQKPYLTDEQAIDVAAFINNYNLHPRPHKKDLTHPDYANIANKPIDYGTGPYLDTFSEIQHKYGPYKPIVEYHKAHKLPVIF